MSRPKLLLADDSITIQKVVNLTFADQGMDVVTFSDGDAAIENLDSIKPDIVLADVHMPGINGYQLCELMRSDEANRRTPVVLLVGSFEPFDSDEAERVGANTHLTKPFTSIADLVSTVEGLLAESKSEEPKIPHGSRPDTSDIDTLYAQSFVETVEIPQNGSPVVEYEIDGYDDEMIQTSYAEPDLAPPLEESFYESDDLSIETAEPSDIETESLIAESMPKVEEVSEPSSTEEIATVEEADSAAETSLPEPVQEAEFAIQQPEPVTETKTEAEAEVDPDAEDKTSVYDPFESIAAEPPPATPSDKAAALSFEDTDLLELPGDGPAGPVEYTVPNGSRPLAKEAVSISPELIELIVQKVIERMEEKN